MNNNVPLSLSKFLLIIAALLLISCSSRKAEVHKKQESVSDLQQNDIRKTESEKIQSDVFKISTRQDINISPRDPKKEMKVVYGKDTLVATNANINISNRQESEKDQTQTSRETSKTDNSTTTSETQKKEKNKSTNRKSASWGLNLGIIFGVIVLIAFGYIHFRTK